MNVRILLIFCVMAFGAPTKLNAVPENDFPAKETAVAEFMAGKFFHGA